MGIAMYLSMSRLLGYGIVTVCILCIMDDHLQTWHLHEDLQVIITPDMCPGQAVGMEPTPYSSHSCSVSKIAVTTVHVCAHGMQWLLCQEDRLLKRSLTDRYQFSSRCFLPGPTPTGQVTREFPFLRCLHWCEIAAWLSHC